MAVRAVLFLLVLCLVVGASTGLSGVGARAAGGEAPELVNAQAVGMTEEGAKLEAKVDPRGRETTVEFWLECQYPPGALCEPVAPQKQAGQIAAGAGEQTVSVSMAGLRPGYGYSFGVAARSAAGRDEAHLRFETQGPGACATGCPYRTGVSLEVERSAGNLAAGAPAREAERQRAAREQAEREAKSNIPSQPPAPTNHQLQPYAGGVSLVGTTLAVKGRASLVKLECLGSASCRGKVTLFVQTSAKGNGKIVRALSEKIGVGSFSIAGDEIKTVKVALDATGRALFSADHGRLKASLAILQLAPGIKKTITKTVYLVRHENTH